MAVRPARAMAATPACCDGFARGNESGCTSTAWTWRTVQAAAFRGDSLAGVTVDGSMWCGMAGNSATSADARTGAGAGITTGAGTTAEAGATLGTTIFGDEPRGFGGLIMTVSVNKFLQRGHSALDPSRQSGTFCSLMRQKGHSAINAIRLRAPPP